MTDAQHETSEHEEAEQLNPWMYVGIVVVSLLAFYITLLLTKLAY